MRKALGIVLLGAGLLVAAGCTTDNSLPGAASAPPTEPLREIANNTYVYRRADLDVRAYHGFYIAPAKLYTGADADFGDLDPDQKQQLAGYLSAEFTRALGEKYRLVGAPGPGIVTLQLTLVGASLTRPVLSAATRLTPVGLGLTALKSVADMPAAFTGSATVAGQMVDAGNGGVLGGFVSRVSPPAFDITSALGRTEAARIAIAQGADQFRAAIDRITGR